MDRQNTEAITAAVHERYSAIARDILAGKATACCGEAEACCGTAGADPISIELYPSAELEGIPAMAGLASLGCGNLHGTGGITRR